MSVYQNLSKDAQQSVYGRAINEYLISKTILKIGESAPAFKNQLSPDGKPVLLEHFKGKYLLIDFWAAWCIPCREEIPGIITLYNKYKSHKFEILGISLDRKREDWIKAISKDKIQWVQASDIKFWDSEVVKLYGIYGLPFNVLIDEAGIIVGINLHGQELEEKLVNVLR